MTQLHCKAIAVAIGLAFSAGALAQAMSKEEYKAGRDAIAADYKAAKEGCTPLSGNASDICKAKASGMEKVAKAELDAKNKPSRDANYKVRVARADADLAVAKEKCDDLGGNVKDVCVKQAKADAVAVKADAKARLKTSDARKTAVDDKIDADYALAKEKCDAFAGDTKSACLSDAKVRFGKS
mgnify:CR=1 FL=1